MQIDISAELLEISNEQYYADWTVENTESKESETIITILVEGYDDSEFLDLTPVFDVIEQSRENVGDSFYLTEVSFNSRDPSAVIQLSTEDNRVDEVLTDEYTQTRKTGRTYSISSGVLGKIDYSEPPLLVGYCSEEQKLSIEPR